MKRTTLLAAAITAGATATTAAAAAFTGAAVPSQTDTLTKQGAAPVKVSCPAGTTGGCSGKLTLKTSNRVGGHILTLGSRNFQIAAGKRATVNVKLSSQGVKLVKHDGHIKPNAIASSHDGAGHHKTRTTKITLKKHSSGNTQGAPQGGLY